ncbi:MAG: DUF3037 domain-containing protein [Acidobacteriaceae bacterium]
MRPPQRQCEFFLVRYMPDPVKEEFVNVGVALYTLDTAGPKFCDVSFTHSWSRAKCLDPDLDPEEIKGLEQQIRDAVWDSASGSIDSLRESFGSRIQLTKSKVVLTESPEAELKLLQDAYLHRPSARSRDHAGARELLVNVMRGAFDREGILSLMTINVPISHYTQDGDPLRIDFGYENETKHVFKMFQAVTLHRDLNAAKALAFSYQRIQEGVRSHAKSQLELSAIVEADPPESSEVSFVRRALRDSGIHVRSVADIHEIAAHAREELTKTT